MEVICIKEPRLCSPEASCKPIVSVGNYYTVIEVSIEDNEAYYELKEHIGFQYISHLFARVSSIDETEFERNYRKEPV